MKRTWQSHGAKSSRSWCRARLSALEPQGLTCSLVQSEPYFGSFVACNSYLYFRNEYPWFPNTAKICKNCVILVTGVFLFTSYNRSNTLKFGKSFQFSDRLTQLNKFIISWFFKNHNLLKYSHQYSVIINQTKQFTPRGYSHIKTYRDVPL